MLQNVKEVVLHHVNPFVAVVVYLFCISMPLGLGFFQAVRSHEFPGWYRRINKPWFTPPDWMFAVSPIIFNVMLGTSSYLLWYEHVTRDKNITAAVIAYLVTLLLSKLYKPLFLDHGWFYSALVNNTLLWLSVAVCIYLCRAISPLAAHLLVPYLGWLTWVFFTTLHIAVNNPNGPMTATSSAIHAPR